MRKQGTVVRFDSDRGFGFIRSPQTSADVFFHIKDYGSRHVLTPRVGTAVSFEEIHVGGKGPRAVAVRPGAEDSGPQAGKASPSRSRSTPSGRRSAHAPTSSLSSGAWFILPLMLANAAVVVWAVWTHRLPWWVLAALPALNLATFFAYWQDKYAAQQDQWRIAESTLHLWSFAGGWAGAWFAQQVLSHKTRKASFREAFWFSVVAHCAALVGWLWWTGEAGTGRFPGF